MGKSTQSFGPMEGLLGSDRLTGQGIRGHQERRADRKLEAKIGSVMNSGRSHSGKFQLRT